ncbi:glucose-1-phosphate cytidylyltransferase [Lutimonas saemankumensis]|uniref:glucose-1-phosphate cytidylyltransferase n=1 Tax=Lutimonas saemankumensis TaxID=483016 RepID=UPI001CD597C1|nr:glucose-1-phosphate cytidylyltransferase [Lutimonas saemankumensis]MCA0931056.1 glucose-1-phosphate cytidylyltransferase [Lutimonas saemankumensis]
MKVVILAGGLGSRLGNVTELIPKPMVEVGGKPILWHIMKIYSYYGYNEFVIALGYKANVIKNYFINLQHYNCDLTLNTKTGEIIFNNDDSEDWKVTLVDTGVNTLKGGRIKRLEKYLDDVNFLTYGDGVANLNIDQLLNFHQSHGKVITISGVKPPSRFGELVEKEGKVISFEEKPQASKGLINGGFMIFNKALLEKLTVNEDCDFEFGPLEELASQGEVMTYKHDGFWECADTIRDVNHLNRLWSTGKAKWKLWD